jgi:Family of unknown function (DUF6152)
MTLARLALTAFLALPGATLAHHGWSEYDSTKELTLTGKIEQVGYEHPHGFVTLTVGGKTWTAVLAPPSRMENRGLPRADLAPGVTVTVVGYGNKGKPDEMRAERITVGGRTVELR